MISTSNLWIPSKSYSINNWNLKYLVQVSAFKYFSVVYYKTWRHSFKKIHSHHLTLLYTQFYDEYYKVLKMFLSSYAQSDQILLTTCVFGILLYHKALKVPLYISPLMSFFFNLYRWSCFELLIWTNEMVSQFGQLIPSTIIFAGSTPFTLIYNSFSLSAPACNYFFFFNYPFMSPWSHLSVFFSSFLFLGFWLNRLLTHSSTSTCSESSHWF